MSEHEIAIVRRAYELFNADESERAMRELFNPDVELRQPAELPGGAGVYRGHQGLRQARDEALEVFDDYRMDPERFHDFGERVVTELVLRGRGKGSDVEVEARIAHLTTVQDGSIVRWEIFLEAEQALAAAREAAGTEAP